MMNYFMMNNLFSIFDPSTSMDHSMNWLSSIYVLLFIPMLYWYIPSRYNFIMIKLFSLLNNEFKILLLKKLNLFNLLIFTSIFLLILLNNFMGMFPYIFTSSSHGIFSLTLALVLWLSFMLFGWIYNSNHMFIHLVPQGTPGMLMSFMVLVESLSNIIRPVTLSVRLCANMIAGHLLMTLISSTGEKLDLILTSLMLIIQTALIVLELSVSIIQAYVFTVLVTLYCAEVN